MRNNRFGKTLSIKGLCLAMIFSSSMLPTFAARTKNPITKSIAPGAIGIIQSDGIVSINGREASGTFTVWGDELVTSTKNARIVFGTLGEVNISPGAIVQLKMEHAKLHEAAGSQALLANLLSGEMNVRLHNDSGALVNSVDSEFTASKGSQFKVDLRDGRASILTSTGTVLANTNSSSSKTLEDKTAPTTAIKKEADLMAAKKLEKLIGSYKLTIPNTVVAEAARREKAMDELTQRRIMFMRSISLSSSNAFFADRVNKNTSSFERSIGAVESLNGMIVNGRLSSGREMLWGGETLEAPKGSGARVAFPSIGQVFLNSGAKAKVTTESVGHVTTEQTSQRVLAAQLLSGDVQIRFDQNASGYVRAGDSVLAGSRGSSFRVEMREGNGAVDVNSGSVMVIGNWPLLAPPVAKDETTGKARLDVKSYNIRPLNLATTMSVGINRSQAIQMRVTDEKNQPVADIPVKFTLNGAGAIGATKFGLSTVEVRTDSRGIASIPYHSASNAGTVNVTAEIPDTNTNSTTTVNVSRGEPFWQGPWPAVITLAGAVGTGLAVYAHRKDRVTITGKGDLLIVP